MCVTSHDRTYMLQGFPAVGHQIKYHLGNLNYIDLKYHITFHSLHCLIISCKCKTELISFAFYRYLATVRQMWSSEMYVCKM